MHYKEEKGREKKLFLKWHGENKSAEMLSETTANPSERLNPSKFIARIALKNYTSSQMFMLSSPRTGKPTARHQLIYKSLPLLPSNEKLLHNHKPPTICQSCIQYNNGMNNHRSKVAQNEWQDRLSAQSLSLERIPFPEQLHGCTWLPRIIIAAILIVITPYSYVICATIWCRLFRF